MYLFDSLRFLTFTALASSMVLVHADDSFVESQPSTHLQENKTTNSSSDLSFEPFTGKITKNKVRVRLQPSLDALILEELPRDTLVSIVGESEEFYAVYPLKDTKAYIFRTFVLDNVVEGSKVNVRLEPALEAPVIAQLNSGDKVDGVVSALNSKWLEITPPDSTRFYVCKEYVEKIGSASLIKELEARTEEVNGLLKTAYVQAKKELQKSYPQMRWDEAVANFNEIITNYSDFPNQVAKAKDLLAEVQKTYLQKKVSYLEAQVLAASSGSKESSTEKDASFSNKEVIDLVQIASEEIKGKDSLPEQKTEEEIWNTVFDPVSMTAKMSAWIAQEKNLYDKWAAQELSPNPYQFYQHEGVERISLQGMIEPYARTVRNKPGDYLLVNQSNNLPIAYLYSTKVNLQEKVGQEVSLKAVSRVNNNFAFPAYYVLEIE